MYSAFPLDRDDLQPDFNLDSGDWFNVEGDLDDFIFFDPAGISSEPSSR